MKRRYTAEDFAEATFAISRGEGDGVYREANRDKGDGDRVWSYPDAHSDYTCGTSDKGMVSEFYDWEPYTMVRATIASLADVWNDSTLLIDVVSLNKGDELIVNHTENEDYPSFHGYVLDHDMDEDEVAKMRTSTRTRLVRRNSKIRKRGTNELEEALNASGLTEAALNEDQVDTLMEHLKEQGWTYDG